MERKDYPTGILWDSRVEDVTQLLSVQDLEKTAERWQELRRQARLGALLERGADSYREALSRICSVLENVNRKIPAPRGFFTEKEDRRVAALEISRGLGLLEAQVQSLRESVALYGQILEHLGGVLAALVRIEAEWTLLLSRARRGDSDVSQNTALPLEALRRERAEVEARMREIPDFCNTVSGFCQETWTAFCLECSGTADIPHNGEGAQIGALSEVLGAFRNAVGGLPRAPEKIES